MNLINLFMITESPTTYFQGVAVLYMQLQNYECLLDTVCMTCTVYTPFVHWLSVA